MNSPKLEVRHETQLDRPWIEDRALRGPRRDRAELPRHGLVELAHARDHRMEGDRLLAGPRAARLEPHPLRPARRLRIRPSCPLAWPHGGALAQHDARGSREIPRGDAAAMRAPRAG